MIDAILLIPGGDRLALPEAAASEEHPNRPSWHGNLQVVKSLMAELAVLRKPDRLLDQNRVIQICKQLISLGYVNGYVERGDLYECVRQDKAKAIQAYTDGANKGCLPPR